MEDGIANLEDDFRENDEPLLARCSPLNLQTRTLDGFTYIVMAEVTVELWPLTNVWLEPRWHEGMVKKFYWTCQKLSVLGHQHISPMASRWLEVLFPQLLVMSDFYTT